MIPSKAIAIGIATKRIRPIRERAKQQQQQQQRREHMNASCLLSFSSVDSDDCTLFSRCG